MSTTTNTIASPFLASPVKRKTMSITQTYFLAHKARGKLSSEAARPDHNLRLLVGHANLLDTLMLELADAEREQESWFNQSVRGASAPSEKATDRHIQWADTVVEEPEEDWQAEDADNDSDASSDDSSDYSEEEDDEDDEEESDATDFYDEDVEMADAVPLRRVASRNKISVPAPITVTTTAVEEEDSDIEVEDDEADYAHLSLTRTSSHSQHQQQAAPAPTSPPELVISEDSDGSSEDEAMPPSPPVVAIGSFKTSASAKDAKTATSPSSMQQDSFDDSDEMYLPPRNPARLISAISVY